jgi:hypothetical protein
VEAAAAAAPAAAPAPAPVAPAPAAAADAKKDGGLGGMQSLLVGGGIAFAAIGSALAFALNTIASIKVASAVAAIVGVVGGIMLLSGFLGWLKLRKRDLSAMLEACGWAVNVRIYLSRRHSLRFTRVPPLPAGSVRELGIVPKIAAEEEKRSLAPALLVTGALVCGVAYVLREPLVALAVKLIARVIPGFAGGEP